MATRTLVIASDKHDFFLSLDAGTLTLGGSPGKAEGILRQLRVTRIRCEVEVEDGPLELSIPHELGGAKPVRPGPPVAVGHARLSLDAPHSAAAPPPPVHDAPPTPVPTEGQQLRLRVVDGADQGRCFPVPRSGVARVGKHAKYADVILHDLYVSRVHCELTVEGGRVTVAHVEGDTGTRIDGTPVTKPTVLNPGSVLRVGNSHLQLEYGPVEAGHEPAGKEPGYEVAGPGSGTLKKSQSSSSFAPVPRKSSDPLAQLEGQTLGHYKLGHVIGRGHTGIVFQAHDLNGDLVVGLKVLSAEFPACHAELERFAHAMTAAGHVRHPNLVHLYGGGKTGPHCWVARECVEGESVAAVVKRIADGEKPSWTRACRVVVHLGRALAEVHAHRLVHGNITPNNVLLSNTDHETKLTDLMLAHALEGSKLRHATAEKKLLAELPYLAPEQTERGAFVDLLADLYAVGTVAYALLTGRPPYTGTSPKEIVAAIHAGRAAKPTALHRKVPATFEAVVMKLMSHYQEDRYQTAAELLADVEAVAADHDIEV